MKSLAVFILILLGCSTAFADDTTVKQLASKSQTAAVLSAHTLAINQSPVHGFLQAYIGEAESGGGSMLGLLTDYEPVLVQSCCKICRKGKACGNSCISRSYTCTKPPGCACDGG